MAAVINGDLAQGEETAQLPPQSIESLLAHIEELTNENIDRVRDLIARF